MRLSRIRLLSPVLLLIIGLALGLLIYHLFTREEKKPEITTEELQMKISQRLRLITEEINYRTDVHLYEAGQHAEGTADLVVYVKYDLEHLQLTTSGDTIYVSLPEAELELGRRPGGDHSVRYYLDRGGRLGEPSADREVIRRLEKRILAEAEAEIRSNPRYLPHAQRQAEAQLQRFLSALAPQRTIIVSGEITVPRHEVPQVSPTPSTAQ